MGKTITYRGIEKCDVVYYLGKILASDEECKICLIDNSYSKDLFESVNHMEENRTNAVSKGNLLYLRDSAPDYNFYTLFDFIFIYLGETRDIETLGDLSLIMPDYKMTSIYDTGSKYAPILDRSEIILRDKVSEKIKESDIANILGIDKDKITGYISFDEIDYSNYINLSYNGVQGIKNISNEYKTILIYLLSLILGETEKNIENIYFKKAKKTTKI